MIQTSDERQALNLKHADFPTVGDYWSEMCNPVAVVLDVTDETVTYCVNRIADANYWEWDLRKALRTSRAEFAQSRRYDRIPDKTHCDVLPGRMGGTVRDWEQMGRPYRQVDQQTLERSVLDSVVARSRPSEEEVLDDLILKILADMSIPNLWKTFTRESGPMDIAKVNPDIRQFARRLLDSAPEFEHALRTEIHYVQYCGGSWFTQTANQFINSGGLTEEWGKLWTPIHAKSTTDAYRICTELGRAAWGTE